MQLRLRSSAEYLEALCKIRKLREEAHDFRMKNGWNYWNAQKNPAADAADAVVQKAASIWGNLHELRISKTTATWAGIYGFRHISIKDDYNLPSDDHCTLWNREGKPAVWVSQPYKLDLAEMAEAAATYQLKFEVASYSGWHNPGSSYLVVWTPTTTRKEFAKLHVFDNRLYAARPDWMLKPSKQQLEDA